MNGFVNVSFGGKEEYVIYVSLTEVCFYVNQNNVHVFFSESDSGKQVIILGSLAGFLIVLFYGLQIARWIYLKKKYPQEEIE